MLREQPFFYALLCNVFLGVIWHFTTFFLCIYTKPSSFSPQRKMFLPRGWERDGKFYSDVLRINQWKDLLPQHTGKDGFSKAHLDDVSVEYLDRFIMETCRGEWNHIMNCRLWIILILINEAPMGIGLSLCVIAGNLPFAMIQRYNRLRLQKLRKALLRRRRQTEKQKSTGLSGRQTEDANIR